MVLPREKTIEIPAMKTNSGKIRSSKWKPSHSTCPNWVATKGKNPLVAWPLQDGSSDSALPPILPRRQSKTYQIHEAHRATSIVAEAPPQEGAREHRLRPGIFIATTPRNNARSPSIFNSCVGVCHRFLLVKCSGSTAPWACRKASRAPREARPVSFRGTGFSEGPYRNLPPHPCAPAFSPGNQWSACPSKLYLIFPHETRSSDFA